MRLYRPARRYLERCDRPTQKRLIERIEALSENPYSHSKLLENAQGKRSSRVGKLRIIFEVDEQERLHRQGEEAAHQASHSKQAHGFRSWFVQMFREL